jgi:hemerythrin-like domain-containing protein
MEAAMPRPPQPEPAGDIDAPLDTFSQCHAGILRQLDAMAELPALMAAAARARVVAEGTLAVFKHAVLEHHAEEETELFPAVMRSAQPEERDHVNALVDRLTSEHRTLEALWKRIEHPIAAAAKGKAEVIDADVVQELVRAYEMHARFEEKEFLPLAAEILGRNGNHMSALGLSLHMRHTPQPVGYI